MSRTGEIRERAEAATEGPWDVEDCEGDLSIRAGSARFQWDDHDSFRIGEPPSSYLSTDLIAEWDLDSWDAGTDDETPDDKIRRADAEFIAAARSDIPFLLEQLSKAEQLIDGIREAVAAPDQFHRRVNSITRLLAGYQATGGSE